MAEEFDPTIPPPFSVAQLAEHWGCSGAMIRKLIDQGKLGHFRIGMLIRIPRFAVEEYERSNMAVYHPPVQEAAAPTQEQPEPASPQRRNIPRAKPRRAPFKRPSHD